MKNFRKHDVSVYYTLIVDKKPVKQTVLVSIDKNNQIFDLKDSKGTRLRGHEFDLLHGKPFSFEEVTQVMENV